MIEPYHIVSISDIEPDISFDWVTWLKEEFKNVRTRFGDDEEAKHFWPDNYYEELEKWWISDKRTLEPIRIYRDKNNIIRINDGWHRVAICYKNNIKNVPAIFI